MRKINEKRKWYFIFCTKMPFIDVSSENLARLQK